MIDRRRVGVQIRRALKHVGGPSQRARPLDAVLAILQHRQQRVAVSNDDDRGCEDELMDDKEISPRRIFHDEQQLRTLFEMGYWRRTRTNTN